MKIEIFNTASEAAGHLAQLLANQISKNSQLRLGVATGRTMDAVYYHLTNIVNERNINCHNLKCFALDEYIGLSEDDEHSFESYLKFHLYRPLNIQQINTFIPKVLDENYDDICQEYEALIKDAGGIDLQIMGVGTNGHIGLNEPGSAHDSRTRVVALTSSTRQSNKASFKNKEVPQTAITMGIGTILEAKECILIATGQSKATIIQKIINADVNSQVPGTALKNHKNATIILDKDAASLI